MRRVLVGLVAALPTLALAAPRTQVHYVMGTYFRISAEGAGAEHAMRRCFREARRLESVFSRFDATSELRRVNAAGGEPVHVSPDFARLLRRAQALTTATDGAFDVTVGGLTEAWRAERAPDEALLAGRRAAVGAERAVLRDDRLALSRGTRLDFDGIAKGWAVDACVALLRAAGVEQALVSLGESSLYALGPVELAVRGLDADEVVATLSLRDEGASISASVGGAAARPHIVDPRSGRPVREPAVAVVVAGSATDAEAYSKALVLWGAGGVGRVEHAGASAAVHIGRAGTALGPRVERDGRFAPLASPQPLPVAAEALR
jgi:thiamine biosynthesis lipoprotein